MATVLPGDHESHSEARSAQEEVERQEGSARLATETLEGKGMCHD